LQFGAFSFGVLHQHKHFAESAVLNEKNFADSLKCAKLLWFFLCVCNQKILLYTKDYQKEGEVQCISAYFAWLL